MALDISIQREARTTAQQDLFLVCAAAMLVVGVLSWTLPGRKAGAAPVVGVAHD